MYHRREAQHRDRCRQERRQERSHDKRQEYNKEVNLCLLIPPLLITACPLLSNSHAVVKGNKSQSFVPANTSSNLHKIQIQLPR